MRRGPGCTRGEAGLEAGAAGAAAARPRWSSGTRERGRAAGAGPGPGAEAPERGRPRSPASALVRRPGCSGGHSEPALRRRLPQLRWGFWRRRRRRAGGNARRIPPLSLGPLSCATAYGPWNQSGRAAAPTSWDHGRNPGDEPDVSLQERFSLCLSDFLPPSPSPRPPSLAPSLHPTPPCPLHAPRRLGEGALGLSAHSSPLPTWRQAQLSLLSCSSLSRVLLGLLIPLSATFPLTYPPSFKPRDRRLSHVLLGRRPSPAKLDHLYITL